MALQTKSRAETFLVAWRRLEVSPEQPLPWLYGVARNVVRRQLHALAREGLTLELLVREPPRLLSGDDADHAGLWGSGSATSIGRSLLSRRGRSCRFAMQRGCWASPPRCSQFACIARAVDLSVT